VQGIATEHSVFPGSFLFRDFIFILELRRPQGHPGFERRSMSKDDEKRSDLFSQFFCENLIRDFHFVCVCLNENHVIF